MLQLVLISSSTILLTTPESHRPADGFRQNLGPLQRGGKRSPTELLFGSPHFQHFLIYNLVLTASFSLSTRAVLQMGDVADELFCLPECLNHL